MAVRSAHAGGAIGTAPEPLNTAWGQTMSRSSNWYTRWPEWLRWIICFPLSVLFSVFVSFFVAGFLSSLGQGERLNWLVQPTASLFAFIFGMYRMTPRWKYRVVLSLIIAYAALALLLVVSALIVSILLPQHRLPSDSWKETISAVLGFSAGFVYLVWLERRKATSGKADEPPIAESAEYRQLLRATGISIFISYMHSAIDVGLCIGVSYYALNGSLTVLRWLCWLLAVGWGAGAIRSIVLLVGSMSPLLYVNKPWWVFFLPMIPIGLLELVVDFSIWQVPVLHVLLLPICVAVWCVTTRRVVPPMGGHGIQSREITSAFRHGADG